MLRSIAGCAQLRLCLGLRLRIVQELQQQSADFARLFLLHPMSRAIDEMTADHVAAGLRLHRFKDARPLMGSPVLLARDEGGRHIDGAARPNLQFRRERARGAAAIPLQAALESGALVLRAVDAQLVVLDRGRIVYRYK